MKSNRRNFLKQSATLAALPAIATTHPWIEQDSATNPKKAKIDLCLAYFWGMQERKIALSKQMGVEQIVVESNELEIPGFADNPPKRCYHCKKELFEICLQKARDLGFNEVLDGANLDDLDDYRPGREAARELKIRSPLLEAGLGKEDIRELSRNVGLATAEKQPFACLASRFPYGTRITAERLKQIDRCESFLRARGFHTFRVRYHNEVARIEVALDELPRITEDKMRIELLTEFKAAGFTYIALDLEGYRTGSMNEGDALTET